MRNQEIINANAPNLCSTEPSKSMESFRALRAFSSESAVMALREFLNFGKDSKVSPGMDAICRPKVVEPMNRVGSENVIITHQDLPAVGTISELNKRLIDEFIVRYR